jgi:heme A synthase
MLLEIYITLVVFAILCLGAAIILGSRMNQLDPTGNPTSKKGAVILLLLIAMVLFATTSLASFNVETEYCGYCCNNFPYVNTTNQTQQWPDGPLIGDWDFNTTEGNTTYVMNINCERTQHIYTSLVIIFFALLIISIIFFFYYAFMRE